MPCGPATRPSHERARPAPKCQDAIGVVAIGASHTYLYGFTVETGVKYAIRL